MEALKSLLKTMKLMSYVVIALGVLSPAVSFAETVTAEYKCTSECTMCLFYSKKTVCSEKYADDSAESMKAKKLTKFVNDGLVVPDDKLKPNFNLDSFASKYFNCEMMIKKADQIREATQNMCVSKVVKYKKTVMVPRMPASQVQQAPVEDKGSR